MAQPQLQPRPAQGVVRFYNFLPAGNLFLDEVLKGLSLPQKSLPSKYLYDARGCELFEKVSELPDYHCARAERAILRVHAAEIVKLLGADCQLIEFGAGSSQTTRILIEELQPPLHVLVDIDGEAMKAAADSLGRQFPWLNIVGVRADYTGPLTLPEFVGIALQKKAAYFPGSKLGHFTPEEAIGMLKLARHLVGAGGTLLAGVSPSEGKTPSDGYNDAGGVAAEFNLNLLARINRELGADFQLRRFGHKCVRDESMGRMEMHVESILAQIVHVGGVRFRFAEGEFIRTEISCNYSADEFRALAQRAGFEHGQTWTDPECLFSVHCLIAV